MGALDDLYERVRRLERALADAETTDRPELVPHDHTADEDGGVLTGDRHDGYSEYAEIATPVAPPANRLRTYAVDDAGTTKLAYERADGTEVLLDEGGAPGDAEYVVEAAHAQLTNERVLGTTVITSVAHGSRQAAARAGRLFLPSDSFYVWRDTGAAWAPWGPVYPMTAPPAIASWAWVNQGTATADESKGGIYLAAGAGIGAGWRILKKPAPSTPYTITVAMFGTVLADQNPGYGLLFRESGTQELAILTIKRNAGVSAWRLRVDKWTNPTSLNTSYVDQGLPAWMPLWLRIEDDGVNRKSYVGMDGQFWALIHSVARTDFLTANEVGFGVFNDSATFGMGALLPSWKEA